MERQGCAAGACEPDRKGLGGQRGWERLVVWLPGSRSPAQSWGRVRRELGLKLMWLQVPIHTWGHSPALGASTQVMSQHIMPYPVVAWSRVLGAHGSGCTPGQGCQCGWCLFGLWRDWAEARGDMSPMAGDGRAGSAETQSHYARQHCTGGVAELRSTPASTCPCAPEPSSCNKGPLSPPQPPHSGLSTCRLGWRWCRGGSEGPFCAG